MNTMSIDPQISEFIAARKLGTLATIKRDGRPQLSNVSYTYDADTGLVRIQPGQQRRAGGTAPRCVVELGEAHPA